MGEAWRDCRNGEASKMGDEEIRRTSVAFEKIPIMSSPWVFHGHIDWVCWWGEFCLAKSSFGCIKVGCEDCCWVLGLIMDEADHGMFWISW